MVKRKLSKTFDDKDEVDEERPFSRKRPARNFSNFPNRTAKPVLYVAKVQVFAPEGPVQASSSTTNVDDAILERIKKCLERGKHHSCSELESKAGFFLASQLMKKYHVSQAAVLAYESPDSRKYHAGQSIVSIRRLDNDRSKPVRFQNYLETLCDAMQCFFNCKYYSTANVWTLDLTFYGIAENTVAAALALESTYNILTRRARSYRGIGSQNSYSLGAADGLRDQAELEKIREEIEARENEAASLKARLKQEIAERRARLARLGVLTNTPSVYPTPCPTSNVGGSADGEYGEGDVEADFEVRDDESVDAFGNIDTYISRLVNHRSTSDGSMALTTSTPRWNSRIEH